MVVEFGYLMFSPYGTSQEEERVPIIRRYESNITKIVPLAKIWQSEGEAQLTEIAGIDPIVS